jgi:hypothetical protein
MVTVVMVVVVMVTVVMVVVVMVTVVMVVTVTMVVSYIRPYCGMLSLMMLFLSSGFQVDCSTNITMQSRINSFRMELRFLSFRFVFLSNRLTFLSCPMTCHF